MGKRQRYTSEFKKEAVSLVLESGMSVAKAALDLGVGKSTLDKWVRQARDRGNDPNGVTKAERAELIRLRKENRMIRLERDLQKKTAVYFAKDSE